VCVCACLVYLRLFFFGVCVCVRALVCVHVMLSFYLSLIVSIASPVYIHEHDTYMNMMQI